MNQWREHRNVLIPGSAALVALAVAFIALGSCDGPKQPSSLPPASTSPPSTASATPTPTPAKTTASASPTTPPQATIPPNLTPDQRSAVNWVLAYSREYNRAISTGKTATLNSLMADDCSCRKVLNYLDDQWRNGSIRAPKYLTISRIDKVVARPDLSRASVETVDYIGSEVHLNKEGKVIGHEPPHPDIRTEYGIERQGATWKLGQVYAPSLKPKN